MRKRGLSVLLQVGDASQIDVCPCQDARFASDLQGPLKVSACTVHIFIERGATRKDEESASRVLALPASQADPTFLVRWAGSDDAGGSALATFTIYVSQDNGPFIARKDNVYK